MSSRGTSAWRIPSAGADGAERAVRETVVGRDGVVDQLVLGDRPAAPLHGDEAALAGPPGAACADLERRGVALLQRQTELAHVRQRFPARLDRARPAHAVALARRRQTAADHLRNNAIVYSRLRPGQGHTARCQIRAAPCSASLSIRLYRVADSWPLCALNDTRKTGSTQHIAARPEEGRATPTGYTPIN